MSRSNIFMQLVTGAGPVLGEGLLEYVGPLVETHVQEKPLSIALREIKATRWVPAAGENRITGMIEAKPDWRADAGPIVVFGAGGGARAVLVGLAERGAREIRLLNRTDARARDLARELGAPVRAFAWARRGRTYWSPVNQARARSWRPGPCTTWAMSRRHRFWPSTARHCPNRYWKANCSVMSGAPSPAQISGGSASSNRSTAGRSFWMKSAN